MKLDDVIRALKTDVEVSPWRSGHVTRAAFPLSQARSKNYKFGPEYRWRLVKFDCLSRSFRLLVLLNHNKQIYRATLAMEVARTALGADDLVVICQYEFHASEPGWHCHLARPHIESLPQGITRARLKRWPSHTTEHSKMNFGITEQNAVSVAAARFRISAPGSLL